MSTPFDIVLSDVVMPGGMNGVSFAQYLQKNLPEMPIILITGYASRLRETHAGQQGEQACEHRLGHGGEEVAGVVFTELLEVRSDASQGWPFHARHSRV